MSYYTPIFFKKFKKVPSFAQHQDTNNFIEPVPSPSFKAKFCASEEQQFKLEWGRIQKVVFDLYASFRKSIQEGNQEYTKMPKGTLAVLHDDIHMLLHSKAGGFVFDFVQRKILPAATEILYESILEKKEEDDDENAQNSENKKRFNVDVLLHAWKHFYSHILPDLEMIFAEVSSQSHLSVRSATLLAFRDGIILKFLDDLISVLQDHSKIKRQIFSLRQMLLVLQNASEKYPHSENKINLEKVVALVVSPYQGYHDLYSGFNDEPVVVDSNEQSIDDLSLLDDINEEENTSLTLCMRSSPGVETLHGLFGLSADKSMQQIRSKGKSKDGGRKRSTSGEIFVQSFRC